jgi:hypothetical protein
VIKHQTIQALWKPGRRFCPVFAGFSNPDQKSPIFTKIFNPVQFPKINPGLARYVCRMIPARPGGVKKHQTTSNHYQNKQKPTFSAWDKNTPCILPRHSTLNQIKPMTTTIHEPLPDPNAPGGLHMPLRIPAPAPPALPGTLQEGGRQ